MNNPSICAVVFYADDDDPSDIREHLQSSGITEIHFVFYEDCLKVVHEILAASPCQWVIHLRMGDRLQPDFLQRVSPLLSSVTSGLEISAACVMNLPVNRIVAVNDGYRQNNRLFEMMMKWGTPSLNFCSGIFDMLCAQQMWEWSSRRNLQTKWPNHYFYAVELIMWLSVYIRVGCVYGVVEPFSVPAYPDYNDGLILDQVRVLFVNRWMGFRAA